MRHPLEYIENVRQKPESTRIIVAAISFIILITFIMVLWISTFSIKPVGTTVPSQAQVISSDQPSPFELIWGLIQEVGDTN